MADQTFGNQNITRAKSLEAFLKSVDASSEGGFKLSAEDYGNLFSDFFELSLVGGTFVFNGASGSIVQYGTSASAQSAIFRIAFQGGGSASNAAISDYTCKTDGGTGAIPLAAADVAYRLLNGNPFGGASNLFKIMGDGSAEIVGNASFGGAIKNNVTIVSVDYEILPSDYAIAVDTTPITITTDPSVGAGDIGRGVLIFDIAGVAGGDGITITPSPGHTINGSASNININVNYGDAFLQWDGTSNWSIDYSVTQDLSSSGSPNFDQVYLNHGFQTRIKSVTFDQIQTAAVNYSIPIFTIPDNSVVVDFRAEVITPGAGTATLLASAGIGGLLTRYMTVKDMKAAANTKYDGVAAGNGFWEKPGSAVVVFADFTSTIQNLDQLSAGSWTFYIAYRTF